MDGVTSFRTEIPPHVVDATHSLQPDLKKLLKSTIRAIAADPECGNSTGYGSIACAAFESSMPFIKKRVSFV